MSNEYKLEKTDIGEMLVIATHALNSNQKQVTLNSEDAVHLLELAYESEALRETLRLKELECQQLAQDKAELCKFIEDRLPFFNTFTAQKAKQLLEKHK